jgi:hypothetical protein
MMSANYSADLRSRVEPCVFGGKPDCSQCGCAISSGLHWVQGVKLAGPVKVHHFVEGSIGVGRFVNRLRPDIAEPVRWNLEGARVSELSSDSAVELVQIGSDKS